MRVRAMVHILTAALLSVPGMALSQEDCRASYSQWDLEDMLIEAFEALEQPDTSRSSHCVFQLDLPGMDVPEAGAEMGHCRWQGVDEQTAFHLDPEQPDQVAIMRGGEALSVLDLCDA